MFSLQYFNIFFKDFVVVFNEFFEVVDIVGSNKRHVGTIYSLFLAPRREIQLKCRYEVVGAVKLV